MHKICTKSTLSPENMCNYPECTLKIFNDQKNCPDLKTKEKKTFKYTINYVEKFFWLQIFFSEFIKTINNLFLVDMKCKKNIFMSNKVVCDWIACSYFMMI